MKTVDQIFEEVRLEDCKFNDKSLLKYIATETAIRYATQFKTQEAGTAEGKECDGCDGRGTVQFPDSAEWIDCEMCDGTGKIFAAIPSPVKTIQECKPNAKEILKQELQNENFKGVYVEETSQARPNRFINGEHVVIAAMKRYAASQPRDIKVPSEETIQSKIKDCNERYWDSSKKDVAEAYINWAISEVKKLNGK